MTLLQTNIIHSSNLLLFGSWLFQVNLLVVVRVFVRVFVVRIYGVPGGTQEVLDSFWEYFVRNSCSELYIVTLDCHLQTHGIKCNARL